MSLTDLDRFKAACVYPGELDEQAVERELTKFLQALGVRRRVVRLPARGRAEDDPALDLDRNVVLILRECVQRSLGVRYRYPRAALAHHTHQRLRATLDDGEPDITLTAVDARAARGASFAGAGAAALDHLVDPVDRAARALVLGIFAILAYYTLGPALSVLFVLFVAAGLFAGTAAYRALGVSAFAHFAAGPGTRGYRTTFWESVWELSWTVCALFGAVERRRPGVEVWLRPLFEAFVSGCWLLYWADDTLYWVAKPTVRCEPGTQRLHHDTHAALESDIVKLYFWHGVRVPRFVIVRPDLITIAQIDRETDVQVRRAMIERYRHGEEIHGAAAFIREAGGRRIDHDERYGTLWRRNIPGDEYTPGDEPVAMIEMVKRTPEPDGRFKHYWLRVPPTIRTAREAVAWTFNMPAERYAPKKET